mmetsp:Transcript_17067/g.28550  ORF Transcript_17067/g.28550 Transcript_17067/m.28550 type:complete len:323 (+) Transcript_17067:9-977(+)
MLDGRFASICIIDDTLEQNGGAIWRVVEMCAMHVCALSLLTSPLHPPLVLVNHIINSSHRALLEHAGAEVIESPPLPQWNSSGVLWARRSCRSAPLVCGANVTKPPRLGNFYRLHLWDPSIAGARKVAYLDPDTLPIRNASALLSDFEPPAALRLGDKCRTSSRKWYEPPGGIFLDGERIRKNDYYWNAGVVVLSPSTEAYNTLMAMFRSGSYPNADPGNYASDQDLLQAFYWRALHGHPPNALPHTLNFRGYPCSYYAVADNLTTVKIVHQAKSLRQHNPWRGVCPRLTYAQYRAILKSFLANRSCMKRGPTAVADPLSCD